MDFAVDGSWLELSEIILKNLQITTLQISVLKIPAIRKNNHSGANLAPITVPVVRSR